MAFKWKEHDSIWKGQGIYFLTFVVAGRRKLLGTLHSLQDSRWYTRNVRRFSNNDEKAPSMHTSTLAATTLTPLGHAISQELHDLHTRIDGIKVCAKQIMPDHLHVVIWITKDIDRTIRHQSKRWRMIAGNIMLRLIAMDE